MRLLTWGITFVLIFSCIPTQGEVLLKNGFYQVNDIAYDSTHNQIIATGLAISSDAKNLIVWNNVDNQYSLAYTYYNNESYTDLLSVDSGFGKIIAGGLDGKMFEFSDNSGWNLTQILTVYSGRIDDIQFINSTAILVSGLNYAQVMSSTSQTIFSLGNTTDSWIRKAQYSAFSNTLVLLSYNYTLSTWNLTTQAMIHDYGIHRYFTPSPVSNDVAVADQNSIVIYNGATLRQNISLQFTPYVDMQYSPSGKLLAYVSNNQLGVRNLDTNEVMLNGSDPAQFNTLQWMGERYVMTGDKNGSVIVWDVSTGGKISLNIPTTLPDGLNYPDPFGFLRDFLPIILYLIILIIAGVFTVKHRSRQLNIREKKSKNKERLYPENKS